MTNTPCRAGTTAICTLCLFLTLGMPGGARAAPHSAHHTTVDISKAPDAADFAKKSQALVEEWYPRINTALFGAGHRLPFKTVQIVFEPDLGVEGAAAYASGSSIHVSSTYIRTMPDDFRAMMIHELTHINQSYPSTENAGWLVEGITDYVRHKYFEKDIQSSLKLDASGKMTGYSKTEPYFYALENAGASLEEQGYLKAYTVASTFLYWLEEKKDKNIVRELNLALSRSAYSAGLFETYCGAPLDSLWQEFVAASKASQPGAAG
ncbi:basic secretory protein-like protein [Undibacterium sp. TJN25]|uniref:basic secretory protein-like protein n=1 Tax=Undibacterium sp. TJN25 TaxID=3413056 RepID=UPI003BF41B4E